MNRTNLKSYAIALLSLANDKDQQERFYTQAKEINELVVENNQFKKLLGSRSISKKRRKEIAIDLLDDLKLDKIMLYWIIAIIDDNNFHNFHYIFKELEKLHHEVFEIKKVIVTSAQELSQQQVTKIHSFLKKATNSEIDLEIKIEPKLIGGIKLQFDNKTYNNTFTRKLADLKQMLLSKKGN